MLFGYVALPNEARSKTKAGTKYLYRLAHTQKYAVLHSYSFSRCSKKMWAPLYFAFFSKNRGGKPYTIAFLFLSVAKPRRWNCRNCCCCCWGVDHDQFQPPRPPILCRQKSVRKKFSHYVRLGMSPISQEWSRVRSVAHMSSSPPDTFFIDWYQHKINDSLIF